jgi:predicted enzyme related to lactoylglutathione lyase
MQKDGDKMQQFYSEVFGWKITNLGEEMGNYRMVVAGEDISGEKWPGINGGITPRMGEPAKSGQPVNAFVCAISVDNLDNYIDKVKKAGGSMALYKMDVPVLDGSLIVKTRKKIFLECYNHIRNHTP